MRLLLLIFISLNLFAGDILTSYRVNGTVDIEKQLDMELSKEEYWKGYLADKDTKFGYIESYSNVLACDKSKSALDFYSIDQNKSFKYRA
ncbi:MAG: hypothetical protein K0A98_13890 [Trueperaceae bacterium]|nr:hypothetical protein [Trueperaceae bacterium]